MEALKKIKPKHGNTKYGFGEMAVKDSFHVSKMKTRGVQQAAYEFCKKHQPSWKFEVSLYSDGKWRCVRVE